MEAGVWTAGARFPLSLAVPCPKAAKNLLTRWPSPYTTCLIGPNNRLDIN